MGQYEFPYPEWSDVSEEGGPIVTSGGDYCLGLQEGFSLLVNVVLLRQDFHIY